jgi:hypothetical protein
LEGAWDRQAEGAALARAANGGRAEAAVGAWALAPYPDPTASATTARATILTRPRDAADKLCTRRGGVDAEGATLETGHEGF